jgi:hypothetical protein
MLGCSLLSHKNTGNSMASVIVLPISRAVSSLQWLLFVGIVLFWINWLCKREDAIISKIPVIPSYVPPQFRLSGPSSLQTQVTVPVTVSDTECKSTSARLFV